MKEDRKYLYWGFVFVAVLGTLAHFVYDWTGKSRLTALFCPVNESTWEHMKLLFYPMLIYGIFLSTKLGKKYHGITTGWMTGTLAGLAAIPVLFYSYKGILGYGVMWIDIAIFYISVAISFLVTGHLTKSEKAKKYIELLCICFLLLIIAFSIFTFKIPDLGIFSEP